jgi:hypothetical protein
MSYQMALLARVVKKGTGELTAVLDFGISTEDFTQQLARQLWEMLMGYYLQSHTRGAVFTAEMLELWFKDTLLTRDDMEGMSTRALCFEVRRERIVTEGNAAIVRFSEEVSIPTCDPAVPLNELQRRVNSLISLGTSGNTDVSLQKGLHNVQQKLALAKAGVDLSVVQWPWALLNNATFGVQPDDFVVFYGRPKSMKTWVLCFLIAWIFEQDKRVLVYTKEMTPDNLYMRAFACILRLAYNELREAASAQGRPLSLRDEQELNNLAAMIASEPDLRERIMVLSGRDVGDKGDTVSWLDSKIDKYRPDVMFVDGMYLLSDSRKSASDHVRVMNISRDLRQLVLYRNTPVIATMQANRKAAGHNDANLDEIAYSDALAQDATIAARVINDKASPTISIVIGGSREFKLHGLRIHGVPAVNFGEHSALTEHDIEKAKELDVNEQEKKEKREPRTDKKGGTKREPGTKAIDDTYDENLKKSLKALNP